MLAKLAKEILLEPDLMDQLKAQDDNIKAYVNDMTHGVMNVQK